MVQDESEVENDFATSFSTTHLDQPIRPVAPRADHVESMPLVAPGLRLWEGFSATVAGTDLEALAKVGSITTTQSGVRTMTDQLASSMRALRLIVKPWRCSVSTV